MTDDAPDGGAGATPNDDAAPTDDPDDEPAGDAVPAGELRERVERAVRQVRWEARKAAAVHAVVDGVVVLLAANLALTVAGVTLPGPARLDLAVVVGLGVVAAIAEFLLRTRQPLVEQFEAANPAVREALRTARDAAADGAETGMARRLYADVLDGLRSASSGDLISTRQVSAGAGLVAVLAVSTVVVSAAGLGLGLGPDAGPGGPTDGDLPPGGSSDYDGLQDGDAVLGEETNVSEGDEAEDVVIGGSTGGAGDAPASDGGFDTGGFAAEGSYDAQQAGFDSPDDVENADIIREYNLRIRAEDDET
ncbi:DUF7502 family protein [Haloglomus litoreum]|uniref:DUF7502 family protein n=1 Tax=Haloglomus litoreum TaxID=3034026 RepID=UPI0023E82EE7|nr:hypothetical protein [Haloglomus sp. DT116]